MITLLLADDHVLVRQGLRLLLEQAGFQVVGEACDGLEAVQLVRQLQPQIAVLDLSMPVMNGLEAARHIKEIAPTTPMVMFTMHVSDALTKDAQAAGIQCVVSKTESVVNQLITSISSLLHEPAT